MAKGTKLSEFKKGEVTALKRVGKSQREILKALGHSKTVICNYLKSPNKYRTRKPTGRPEKVSSQYKRRLVHEVKKKTSSTSKLLKSEVDAPCRTRTIRRHLNNKKIKHKKRIHHLSLTMGAKEWRKVVFSGKKKFNLDSPDGFQKYWHIKDFPEENYSIRHSGRGSHMILGDFLSSGKLKLQFVSGRQKVTDYVKMLNDLSFAQVGCRLCGEGWTFQQDNAAIYNASITKKYLLEHKIRHLDHIACSLHLYPIIICGNWLLLKFMNEVDST